MSLTAFLFGSEDDAYAAVRNTTADDLLDGYVAWREASADVEAAYRRWATCGHADRGLAFGAYLAALEHEEHAARVYERRCRSAGWRDEPDLRGERRAVR